MQFSIARLMDCHARRHLSAIPTPPLHIALRGEHRPYNTQALVQQRARPRLLLGANQTMTSGTRVSRHNIGKHDIVAKLRYRGCQQSRCELLVFLWQRLQQASGGPRTDHDRLEPCITKLASAPSRFRHRLRFGIIVTAAL
jgi:hypothetical protein